MEDMTQEQMDAEEAKIRQEETASVWGEGSPETPIDDTQDEAVEEAPQEEPQQRPEETIAALQLRVNELLNGIQNHELRIKQAESRVGSIQNEMHAAKQAARQMDNAPSQKEIADASASTKEWEDLKQDYPEWAALTGAIEKKFAAQKAPQGPAIEDVDRRIEEIRAASVAEIQRLQRGMTIGVEGAKLSARYPDWEETVNTPEYKQFMAIAPPEILKLASSDYAKDAAAVLDAFHKSAGKPPAKSTAEIQAERQRRLKASQTTQGRGVSPSKADLTDEELRRQIAKQVWAD